MAIWLWLKLYCNKNATVTDLHPVNVNSLLSFVKVFYLHYTCIIRDTVWQQYTVLINNKWNSEKFTFRKVYKQWSAQHFDSYLVNTVPSVKTLKHVIYKDPCIQMNTILHFGALTNCILAVVIYIQHSVTRLLQWLIWIMSLGNLFHPHAVNCEQNSL